MKKLCASFVGALAAAVLLIAGCSNPVQDAAEQSGLNAGTGKVLLSLSGQTSRTLIPGFDGLSYTISLSGSSTVAAVTDWNGTGTREISLPVGPWTITVTEKNGETKVSEGSKSVSIGITDRCQSPRYGSKSFTVSAETLTVEVALTGVFESGTGIFTYAIQYPARTTVNISMEKLPDLTDRIDLTAPEAGAAEAGETVAEVPAGFYLSIKT